tara:strand:- start:22427 stop:23758 length:1332 start_codon:yes stop_codon:yes gene_type:complete
MYNGDGGWYSFSAWSFPLIFDMSTDVFRCNWGDGSGAWSTQFKQSYTPTNGGFTHGIWGQYRNISRHTLNIDRIQSINDVGFKDELKNRYISEIKAIRAWTAYLLYTSFGTFPIATLEQLKNPLDEVELERSSVETVESLIENDLNDAIANLPVDYSDAEYGRVTKGHAMMLLLKFYMFKKRWSEAENVARDIIALGKYDLMANYKDIFTKENRRNKELIYSIPASETTGGNYWVSWTLPYNFPTENPTIDKWNGYRLSWEFYETFEEGDERLETIFDEYVTTTGETISRENDSDGILRWGPIPLKYGEDPDVKGYKSSIDLVVFRYSDVLLSLAEAINNTVGPTEEAIALVDRIRARVGLPKLLEEQTADRGSFNNAILHERKHELYCEGFSREDLIRHGKLIETLSQFPGSNPSLDKILYPIPQSAITRSKGIIKQNPGYN